MTRIRTTFTLPFTPAPAVPEMGKVYPTGHFVSVEVEILQGIEYLNKVIHTSTDATYRMGTDERILRTDYMASAIIIGEIEEGTLTALFGPNYDTTFDKLLNATVVWDLSRTVRHALNLVAQSKTPPTKTIEIGLKGYR